MHMQEDFVSVCNAMQPNKGSQKAVNIIIRRRGRKKKIYLGA